MVANFFAFWNTGDLKEKKKKRDCKRGREDWKHNISKHKIEIQNYLSQSIKYYVSLFFFWEKHKGSYFSTNFLRDKKCLIYFIFHLATEASI